MYAKLENPLFARNVALGLLLAASLILPTLAHADGIVVCDRFRDQIVGQGPDLVLIPGLASSRDTWKAVADHLKNHDRLHLIQVAVGAMATA